MGAYERSPALLRWFGPRVESIGRIARAHADIGEVEGPGRPLELGRPLAHAYIIRAVAEFQGFVRDLHDLGIRHLVVSADPPERLEAILTRAIETGRMIDAGNATMTALRTDFGRDWSYDVANETRLRVGDRILVPWGVETVEGEVIEIWGDPPAHVRVALELEKDQEPELLLLSPSIITRLGA